MILENRNELQNQNDLPERLCSYSSEKCPGNKLWSSLLIVEWFAFLHNFSIISLPLFLRSSAIRNANELNH